jgi:hypothetical protein
MVALNTRQLMPAAMRADNISIPNIAIMIVGGRCSMEEVTRLFRDNGQFL